MRTSKIKVQAMTIPVLTSSNGERYWPMRPLCEAIELNWHSQAAKLHPPRYTPREHDVCLPGQPPMKQALCLSQAEFEFWLKGLSSRKVMPAPNASTCRTRTSQLCCAALSWRDNITATLSTNNPRPWPHLKR